MTHEEALELVEDLTVLAGIHSGLEDYSPDYLVGYLESRLAQTMVECPMARVSIIRHIQSLKSL